ncbi:MAG: FIVAR domain-containing protein, partial [Dysgonamonadaceae bacterium]|nr:FIVAR domain-containing protein [Dysgonamonadaceae bacterium]
MKKVTFFAFAMLFALLSGTLQAQTDVTAQYLTNADFETAPIAYEGPGNTLNSAATLLSSSGLGNRVVVPAGWTAECGTPGTGGNAQYTRLATGLFGVDYTSIPDAFNGVEFPTSDRTGAFLALSGGYGTTPRLVQNVNLPAGQYTLRYDVYDQNPGKAFTNLFGFVPNDGTAVYDNLTSLTASAWETRSVSFTLDALTAGKISIGITGNSGNSGANAHLAVDNIKLFFTGDLTVGVPPLKETLTALRDSVDMPASYDLTAVNTLLTTTPTAENALQLIADLNAAIATLQGVIAQNVDATLASLTVDDTAISGFAPATLSYSYLVDGSGVPVVAATAASNYASANVAQATVVPGAATVTVIAGNGTQRVYTINFGRPMVLPVSGSYYHIKSFATDSTYIGGSATGNDAVKHENASTNPDFHIFLLTGDNTSGFTLKQVASGLYITHNNAYTGSYAAATGTNTQLFKIDNTVSSDYLVIKKKLADGTFADGIGFDSGASGTVLYFNKGISAGNQWIFEPVEVVTLITAALENAITAANDLLTNTVEGNDPGQYPSKADLQAAVTTAQGVLSSATTQLEIDDAVTALNAAIAAYQATKVFLIASGNVYRIKNYTTGNTYIGGSGTGNDAVKHEDASTNPDYQLFFAKGDNTIGWTFLQVASGLFVTHNNSYTGSYAAATGTNTQMFKLDDTQSADYVVIQKKGTTGAFSNGIGYNSTTSGSILYFDKGTTAGNRWVFEKVENAPLVTISLQNAITAAQALADTIAINDVKNKLLAEITTATGLLASASSQTQVDDATDFLTALRTFADNIQVNKKLYDTTEEGTAGGQYPAAARTEFLSAINTAITAFTSATTADDANTANTALNTANYNYLLAYINPFAGFTFNLKHYNSSFYVSRAKDNSFTNAHIQALDTATYEQNFVFEKILGVINGVRMRTLSGYYLNHSGYTSSWVTSPVAGSDMIVEKNASGYVNLKFVSDNGYFGTDSNADGSDIFTNKNGTGNNHHWIIEITDPRAKLGILIDEANVKLAATVPGTEIGQYPQAAINTFTSAIETAQAVYDNPAATSEQINAAADVLQAALSLFISQEICFSTDYVGKQYWIVHSSGNLLSKVDYNTQAVINLPGTANALQTFEFKAVPGQIDVVALKSSDGKYLSYNSWNTPWLDSINTAAHLKISNSDDGYLLIKFVGNNYLGTDDAPTDSAGVWADHSATRLSSKWGVQAPGSVIKLKLRAVIVQSDTLLNHISAGNELYQFSTSDYNTFTGVLNASKTVLNNASATQAEVDAQVAVLNDALTALYAKQILPVLTPETSARYLVTNKSYSGYLTDNGIRAVVEANVPLTGWEILKLTDSTYVFKRDNLALAQSLNMVTYVAGAADQVWKLHYDGAKAYEVYTPDTLHHFAFIGGVNAMQFTSGGQVQLVAGHTHTNQAQWFAVSKIGAPITTALSTLITEVQSVLSSATVGTAYGNYPQAAMDDLTTALTQAQSVVENAASMTQAQINAAVTNLQNSLTWFNNQKIVWLPEAGMAYFIGNRDNANYLSIDTLEAGVAKGYKLDSIPFVNQLWFFMPVENKAGFYHIVNGKNSVGNSGGTAIFVEEYDAATAKEIEVQYANTTSGTDYFWLVTTNTYPRIHIDSNGNISSDRYSNNNYQLKLVAAGALRTEIFYAVQLRDSASVGNGIGQYTQDSYDVFVGVINTSIETATDEDSENDEAQLQVLRDAENVFRTSQNGYGLNLAALLAAVETANDLLETTTIVGSNAGQCPQTVVDALAAAIAQSQDATGGITQPIIDQKVTALNQAIAGFKTALKASTGLTDLLTASLAQHNDAVEGTNPGQYAAGSKAIFKTAIDAAQAIFDHEPVVQSALIAAYDALNDARDDFNAARVSNLDTDDLAAVIAEVEAFLADKP